MNNRLIVGFDGSQASISAVHWAAAEAEIRGASVRVVSSYSMPVLTDYYGIGAATVSPAELSSLREMTMAGMGAVVASARSQHRAVAFEYDAINQPARDMLIAAAAKADMLVVGSSGAGAARAFLLGSVTQAVIRLSPCPVAVVRGGQAFERIGRIVVGTDGSEQGDDALRWATDEADLREAELIVVHAWEYPYRSITQASAEAADLTRVDAACVLDRAVEMSRDHGTGNVRGELIDSAPAGALLDTGKEADMIVVGSRGRGGFRSMVFGSVAQSVTAHSTCPVIVVR